MVSNLALQRPCLGLLIKHGPQSQRCGLAYRRIEELHQKKPLTTSLLSDDPKMPVMGPAVPSKLGKNKEREDDQLQEIARFRRVRIINLRAGHHDSDDNNDIDGSDFSRDYYSKHIPGGEMHGRAVSLFDFTIEHENELPLKEGQVVFVSYRHSQGWLVATDPQTGESGLIPEEYVRLLRTITKSD
jgi:hypothetical protein